MTWGGLDTEQKPKEMKEYFKPAKEIVQEQGLKILVWGDSEVGKELSFTSLIGKAVSTLTLPAQLA